MLVSVLLVFVDVDTAAPDIVESGAVSVVSIFNMSVDGVSGPIFSEPLPETRC